ncbi:MAG: hypothetical protein ACOH5I_03040 [Oligoflexus sp.]
MQKCPRFAVWLVALTSLMFWESKTLAEPWLGTRFAQNCAACHAPGRKNLPPILRRCSLSCQGCHVNPNGGGLRSFYGKWNEDYWLRSMRTRKLKQPKPVAPFHKQFYGRKQNRQAQVKNMKKIIEKGFPLVLSQNEFENELLYDRYHDKFYHINAKSRREFEYSIPQDDPYRQMDESKIDGGADFRLFAFKNLDGPDTALRPFLMEMSYGLRYRPLRHTHFVYESRFFGRPIGQRVDLIPGTEKTRSMYAMVDDLPWNGYVMYGYYKPLFGNYTPDHTSLAQVMVSNVTTGQGNTARNIYRALSLGSAPNVPFGNLHYISKRVGDNRNENETGFAGNFGLRFVSFGLQVTYSFWATQDETDKANTKQVEMHAFEARGTYQDYIVGIEAVSMARDDPTQDFREGGVITLEGKYRFWLENYATLEYAIANTGADLTPGTANQIKIGSRHFLIPGFNLTFQYTKENNKTSLSKSDRSYLSMMVHSHF